MNNIEIMFVPSFINIIGSYIVYGRVLSIYYQNGKELIKIA